MNKILIGIVSFVIIAIVAFFVLGITIGSEPIEDDWEDEDGESIGTLLQTIQVNYLDGTTSTVGSQWIYSNSKKIDTLTYKLSGITNSTGTIYLDTYNIGIDVFGNSGIINTDSFDLSDPNPISISANQEKLLASYTFSPYDLLDYDEIPDGYYNIKVTPSGSISWNGKSTTLPSAFEFGVDVKDERAVEIDFET